MQTDTLIGTVPCSAEQMAYVIRRIAIHLRRDGFSADTERLVNDLLFSERDVGLGLDAADFDAPLLTLPTTPEGYDLPTADDVNDEIRKVHATIMRVLNDPEFPPSSGGCRVFYTPLEWRMRGEQYGRNSTLIVVHDGGDHAPYFAFDYEAHVCIGAMNKALAAIGYYAEPCTGWYTAIYPL